MGEPVPEAVDYGALKKGGFMRQIQKNRFSMRLRVVGGRLEAAHLVTIAQIAEKYGEGYVHLTSRQGVEIPFIALEDIEAVKEELARGDLQLGACGPRVRTVTACQGAAICPGGLIETGELARELDRRYYGRELPHKFKIGIAGCKNNCLKAEENDLGIKGGLLPAWDRGACTFCGLCEAVCPAAAITVTKAAEAGAAAGQTPALSFREGECLYCGRCVKTCPSGAWQGKKGYLLFFGGMFGNEIRAGKSILPLLFEKEQVLKAADAALSFFQTRGKSGERFGKTIGRTGEAALREEILGALG